LIETVLNWRKELERLEGSCARARARNVLPRCARARATRVTVFAVAFVFRANSFSKVTSLFCRFPLLTLFYRRETVDLRDLLRIFVRSRAKIILSLWFSWSNWNKSDENSEFFGVLALSTAKERFFVKWI